MSLFMLGFANKLKKCLKNVYKEQQNGLYFVET